ncbi:MAG: FAD-dependent oxidoreductase [Burkholderiales bacterium]
MPILALIKARFDYTVPVVIIGAGACGLTAALAATEAGARVLVLERDDRPTGSTALSTGLIPAAGTKLQRAHGIDDSPELLARDITAKAKGQNDPAIVEAVARASGPTIDWLSATHRVAFTLVEGFLYPGHSRLRMHGTPNRTGTELQAALLAATARLDIDLLTNALVTDLYADARGKVGAVRFARPDGALEIVGCNAVILACCGYGGDKDMVRQYIPEIADAEFQGHVGNRGDAVKWGLALGAAALDMGSYQGHGGVAHPHGNPMNWGLLTEGGFQVNAMGVRFSNEVRGYSEQAVDVIAQPGRIAWDIFDEMREQPILGFTDYQEVMALGGIKKASTVRGLADLLGVPADALERTMDEVNEIRSSRRVCPWGRDFSKTRPLSAPFCGVKITGALFHTQGGVAIDASARVLRADGSTLPNLFAGGGAARGLSGPSRWGYFSGGGLLTATTLGRIAGTSAAALVNRSG